MRSKRWQSQLLILVAYTLLALLLTWPVASKFGTHVPGDGADDPPLTWNLWWVRYALLEEGSNPFDSDYLFYPLGINLAFYTLTVLNGLLSIPLQLTVGLIPASNLILLSSFALSGYGAFLLASYILSALQPAHDPQGARSHADRRRRQRTLAAFVAGMLYAFASSKLAYAALGQWNIASSQWIPFYALYLFKMGEHPHRRRYAFFAGILLVMQAYAELTYATFLVLFTALWAAWRLWAAIQEARLDSSWRTSLHRYGSLLIGLAMVGILFVVGLSPVLAMMLPDLMAEGDIFVEGSGFADVFSADFIGFLIPSSLHPALGSLVELFSFDYEVGQHIYVGYSVLVLVLVGAIMGWRQAHSPTGGTRTFPVRYWILSAIFFWLLALGPTLRINGHDTALPLPFAAVSRLPFFSGNRYPSRYSVMLVLSLSMLVTNGLVVMLERGSSRFAGLRQVGGRRVIALLLVGLLLFEHLSVPLPLSDMEVPKIYQTIADERPGDYTLLDLPVAWRNGFRVTGTQHPIIMFEQYYQTVHGKRILAGNTSRNPPLKFQYFTEAPVINSLIALETGYEVDAAISENDRRLAALVLRFFSIEVIVVHPEFTGPGMIPYLETTFPVRRLYADETLTAYEVELPPWPEQWIVDADDELSRLSYAEGWGVPARGVNWAQRRSARLLVPLNGQPQRMTFRVYTPGAGQRVDLELNGQVAAEVDLAQGWSEHEIRLPGSLVQAGLNEIWLRFETLFPADETSLAPRIIGDTGAASPVSLVVRSAGQEVGDYGYIYADGRNVSANQIGYNVAVFSAKDGHLEQAASFDTHWDPAASQSLAEFFAGIAPGRIVAVAAADEASRLLGQEAVDALHGIGATGDLRNKTRWGQAIIGVQGALPGTALEASDWMRPVTVLVGDGLTEPFTAAAFAPIVFVAAPEP
jgi:hypothetical protein